jgi:hypothetical protein
MLAATRRCGSAAAHTGCFEEERGRNNGEVLSWRVGAAQVEQGHRRESIGGAGVGKMLQGISIVGGFLGSSAPGGSSPSSASPPFLPRPSLLGGGGGTGENTPGALGFRGCGWGLLIHVALGLGRVGTAAILGFHATAMWHASHGCGSGVRVFGGARAVKGEVERGRGAVALPYRQVR